MNVDQSVIDQHIAAELLQKAREYDQASMAKSSLAPNSWAVTCAGAAYRQVATDLRARASKLSTGATP